MSWTAPFTAISGSVFTAAQFNQYVRDNLNATAPALATTTGSIFATVSANQIAERIPAVAVVGTSETTTSTGYTNLATVGPSVTCTTGSSALVCIFAGVTNNTAGAGAFASYTVSGASTIGGSDSRAVAYEPPSVAAATLSRAAFVGLANGLTPGVNTFTLTYRASAGTATFDNRTLTVIPF